MSSQKCDICFEEKSPDSFGFLPCTHSFCAVCIGKLRENVCPMCRNPFEEYSQTSYANSAPNPTTITTFLGNREPREQVSDDFYINQEMQVHRRLDERTRRRMRRRRRRLTTNRRRRRSETVTEEIFQIDDIVEEDSTQEEKPKTKNRITKNEK